VNAPRQHDYRISVRWTGNLGTGTSAYTAYSRNHEIESANKPPIAASSDPSFRGDRSRYNPEELLVASLSSCHMLWFLHLCAVAGVVVSDYEDHASGIMEEQSNGSGHFVEVVLHPKVTLISGDPMLCSGLHERAHEFCFIANSVNFPVRCEPETISRAETSDNG
jgi:organic hydroperoxide reductase OsmC/OhrA